MLKLVPAVTAMLKYGELVECGFRGVPKQKNDWRRQQKVVHMGRQLPVADDEMDRLHVELVVTIDRGKLRRALRLVGDELKVLGLDTI